MTAFIIICTAMCAVAVWWVARPLLGAQTENESARRERRWTSTAIAILIPACAAALYATWSSWDWDRPSEQTVATSGEMDEMLARLEARLRSNPNDVNGWLMLGRSYTALGRFSRAADAYQQAYDLTKGGNIEAVAGLAEALTLTDEASLSGRAGQLFEAALKQSPNHPKALWYGGIAALRDGRSELARDRLQALLAQNPPQQIREILETQVAALNEQLGAGTTPAPQTAPMMPKAPSPEVAQADSSASRTIRVAIGVAPELSGELRDTVPLFVLARDPAAAGPPLAVKRLSSQDLPIVVELTERDAMMPARTIASVPRVQVVARLSKKGTPQAQSGDFYGQADYDFARPSETLHIMIDRKVP